MISEDSSVGMNPVDEGSEYPAAALASRKWSIAWNMRPSTEAATNWNHLNPGILGAFTKNVVFFHSKARNSLIMKVHPKGLEPLTF